jgi:hypothetical protein
MLSNVPARRLLRTTPATTLAEMPKTLRPEALETAEELRAFYRDEIQEVRGVNRTGELRFAWRTRTVMVCRSRRSCWAIPASERH